MGVIKYKNKTYGGGNGGSGSDPIECTQAEYDALEAEGKLKADTFYLVKDGVVDADTNVELKKIYHDSTGRFPGDFTFTKRNGIVQLAYDSTTSASVPTGDLGVLFTVDDDFKPYQTWRLMPNYLGINSDKIQFTIEANGDVTAYNYGNAVTSTLIFRLFDNYLGIGNSTSTGAIGGNTNLGNSDISDIGDGTVTGAIKELDSNITTMLKTRTFTGTTDSTYGTINLPSDIPVDRVLNVYMYDGSIYYNASLRGVGNVLVWNYDANTQKVVPITGTFVSVTVIYY